MELINAARIESLEAALNLLLQTRPMLRERLQKLSGKTLRLVLLPQNWSLLIRLHSEGIELSQDREFEADVSLKGELGVLIKLITEPRSVLFGQGAEIGGDAALLQRLQKALREPGLDWELWLSEQLGDLPTSALTQAFAPVSAAVRESKSSLQRILKSYLQEELEALPPRAEYELWANSVSKVRTRTEQLELRISKLLESKLSEPR